MLLWFRFIWWFVLSHVLKFIFQYYSKPPEIVVDGGISRSSFILESLAQLSSVNVQKSECVDGSLIGAALLAGLGAGLYQSLTDIKSSVMLDFKLITQDTKFSDDQIRDNHEKWHILVEKCVHWSNRLA